MHIATLVRACPNLHVLSTSRAPLRIEGERGYENNLDRHKVYCLAGLAAVAPAEESPIEPSSYGEASSARSKSSTSDCSTSSVRGTNGASRGSAPGALDRPSTRRTLSRCGDCGERSQQHPICAPGETPPDFREVKPAPAFDRRFTPSLEPECAQSRKRGSAQALRGRSSDVILPRPHGLLGGVRRWGNRREDIVTTKQPSRLRRSRRRQSERSARTAAVDLLTR